MDKHILALASVFGIVRETHLQGEQYSLVLQPLSAFFLVRFRLSIYMPILVICWGTTLACMAAARNFTGLVVSRFFLGGFETSTQAAFILMGQMWYKRQEQGLRLMIWFSNVGWVDIVGSLIMYGFGHINKGSIHSYQIAFIALGAVTAATGIASKFLTQEEKVIAVERIRANQQGVETKIFKLTQVVETLLDLKSWCWMGLLILHATPTGAITVFGPLVVKGFGYDGYDTMLFLIPYGALQVIAMVLSYWVSTKIHTKSPLVLIFLIPCMIGMIILYTTGRDKEHQPALLVAYYLLAAQSAVTPTMLGWQAVNTAGHTKKASTTAMTIMGSYTGGIVGPLLFQPKDGPYYHSGILACIICYSGAATLTARRVAVGKPAKLIDHSMTSAANEKDGVGSPEGSNIGKRAFEDLTDLQNDEFIYVL
ncbi:MFS general substrate transporter [Coprinellus micaceus]|uniref:MFS general substrate transporter n=1 Tax=Coprinellus micaceus TaxID=71717 RepID=A0A4Y7SCE6_COPMI|nr:MFS general substrate transporter [Coprinellus micaceus]